MGQGRLHSIWIILLTGAALSVSQSEAANEQQDDVIITIPKEGLTANTERVVRLAPSKVLRVEDLATGNIFLPQANSAESTAPSQEAINAVAYRFDSGICDFTKIVPYKEVFPKSKAPFWVILRGGVGETPGSPTTYVFTNPPASELHGSHGFCVRIKAGRGAVQDSDTSSSGSDGAAAAASAGGSLPQASPSRRPSRASEGQQPGSSATVRQIAAGSGMHPTGAVAESSSHGEEDQGKTDETEESRGHVSDPTTTHSVTEPTPEKLPDEKAQEAAPKRKADGDAGDDPDVRKPSSARAASTEEGIPAEPEPTEKEDKKEVHDSAAVGPSIPTRNTTEEASAPPAAPVHAPQHGAGVRPAPEEGRATTASPTSPTSTLASEEDDVHAKTPEEGTATTASPTSPTSTLAPEEDDVHAKTPEEGTATTASPTSPTSTLAPEGEAVQAETGHKGESGVEGAVNDHDGAEHPQARLRRLSEQPAEDSVYLTIVVVSSARVISCGVAAICASLFAVAAVLTPA